MKDKQYNKIVKKIKGLLAIAEDHKNDEESQSAFMMAQKLMIKYNVEQSDVDDSLLIDDTIDKVSVTVRKRLFWWERTLSGIIAENFRVKHYYNDNGNGTKVVFYGFERDLEIAKEIFLLAYEALNFHQKEYIKWWYDTHDLTNERDRSLTAELKRNYIRGYLNGLNEGFSKQVAELKKGYDLVVITPKEVEESYEEFSSNFGEISIDIPIIDNIESYQKGYETGKEIDFTQSTVGTEDWSFLLDRHIIIDVVADDSHEVLEETLCRVIKVYPPNERVLSKVIYQNSEGQFVTGFINLQSNYEFAEPEESNRFEYKYIKVTKK